MALTNRVEVKNNRICSNTIEDFFSSFSFAVDLNAWHLLNGQESLDSDPT